MGHAVPFVISGNYLYGYFAALDELVKCSRQSQLGFKLISANAAQKFAEAALQLRDYLLSAAPHIHRGNAVG